jgi:hypothetical protein
VGTGFRKKIMRQQKAKALSRFSLTRQRFSAGGGLTKELG